VTNSPNRNLHQRISKLEQTVRPTQPIDLSWCSDEELIVLRKAVAFTAEQEQTKPSGRRPVPVDLSILSAAELQVIEAMVARRARYD
jgi:hypothetical protein